MSVRYQDGYQLKLKEADFFTPTPILISNVIGYALQISISSRTSGNKNLRGTTQEDDPTPAYCSGRCSPEDYAPLEREKRKSLRPSSVHET